MSVIMRITRRFTYPVESPFTSLTLYYGVLIGAAVLLYHYAPILRPAFTGARLMHMAGQGDNIFADQAPSWPVALCRWSSPCCSASRCLAPHC